jgi:hypothetical protein
MILTLSDYKELKAPEEAEGLYTENLQGHLATFLSYLTFWQDVLEHCRSVDVRQTLLDHLQVLFLHQLLYPSMLESSDIDGGSSVAVLTYLRQILDALDHDDLTNLVLQYLLALPEPTRARSPTALKRRSSLLLLAEPVNEDDRMNPALFNLIDLLQTSVTSANPQTVIAALKLTTVILGKNHFYAVDTLIQTRLPLHQDMRRTHGALDTEVEAYVALAEGIAGLSGLDKAYENHLKDAMRLIESHGCSNKLLDLGAVIGLAATKPLSNPIRSGNVLPHMVLRDDTFLNKLLTILKTFFTNNVELNLAVTETLVTLFTCPLFSLEGWLAVEPKHYQYASLAQEDCEGRDQRRPSRIARLKPTWEPQHAPALMTTIRGLSEELDTLKVKIADLDGLIAARKQAFRVNAEIEEAMRGAPLLRTNPKRNSQQGVDVSSPTQSSAANVPSSSIQQRFLDAVSRSPSRSQSRGRRANITSSPTPSAPSTSGGFLSQYAPGLVSPPPSISTPSRSRPRASEQVARQSSDTAFNLEAGHANERQLLQDVMQAANEERMKQQITFPARQVGAGPKGLGISEENNETEGNQVITEQQDEEAEVLISASLGHVLTNAVLLQEFVLEVTAIMQVRASMFGEVAFA